MLWPSAQAEAYNAALAMKYFISVALGLKRLDTSDPRGFASYNADFYLIVCISRNRA